MPWLAPLTASLALGYPAAVLTMALCQRRLLYRPARGCAAARAKAPAGMCEVRQGTRLLGWFAPPPTPTAPVLVFFHGNCGTLARVAGKVGSWRRWGLGLFAATYRGYEGNPGWPDEKGLYADGRAVLAWLAAQGVAGDRLILYGESLGSGVAAHLAAERPVRALVLEAPYASVPEVAAGRYPWTPARLLVRDRFDTKSKIDRVDVPLLILHGAADRTIPVDHAIRLAARAPRAQLVVLPHAGHIDLYEHGAQEVLGAFLANLPTQAMIEVHNASCHGLDPDR